MTKEGRIARAALILSITSLLLGPAAGFAAGIRFAEAAPVGPQGPAGPPGPPGPRGVPGLDGANLSGALVLSEYSFCPADTSIALRLRGDVLTIDGSGRVAEELKLCEVP